REISRFLTPEERSHTMIAISNDPFFAQRCDRLLYLDEGRLILDAPYDEAIKDERVRITLGISEEAITP
ncbi:MAG: hypothetical protein AAFP08_15760, partial [Bacteroidota bacterium]